MFNGGKRQHQNGIVYLPTRAAVGSNINLPNIFSLKNVLLQRPSQEHVHSIQLILMRKKLLFKKGILPTYQFFHNLVTRAAVGSNINLLNIFSLNNVLLQRLQKHNMHRCMHNNQLMLMTKNIVMWHSVNLSICP